MTKINRQKKRTINTVSKIIAVGWGLISVVLFTMLIMINVLPTKYMVIIYGIYGPFLATMIFLLWIRNIKTGIKIAINVLAIIIIAGFSFGIFYMYKTMHFMDLIQSKDYQIEEYYVIALKDASYQDLEDLEDEKLGYLDIEGNYAKAIDDLDELVTADKKEYQSFTKMAQDLLDGDVDAIFMGLSHKSIVEDLNVDFASKTKIVKIISLKVDNDVEVKEVNVSKQSFNIYISGIDIFGNISLKSRSDVNIIMTVNPNTHQILLTSIPRDYYVQLHDTTGYKDKLTHAGIYGVDMSVKTIEDLLDIDINYYVRVNFTTLISLVDSIGGVDIYSDKAFYTSSGTYVKKGNNHMKGDQALAFARERHAIGGDIERGQNQQKVITAILNKMMSSQTLITKYTSILNTLSKSFQTNMDSSKIYELVNKQIDEMPSWQIDSINLSGSDGSGYTYSYQAEKLYVMIPDMNTVYAARERINRVEGATR